MSTTVVDEEFRRRLRLIMQQFGSVADLARAVGVSDNAIYKWVSGRGQPGMISLVNLAKAAGVSVEWLATGQGTPAKEKAETVAVPEPAEFIIMPNHVLKSGGNRNSIQSSQIVDYLSFRGDWLRRVINTDPRSLLLVEAVGDAMSPTIDEGDLVLADLRESRFRHDGIYVFRAGGTLAIKRIQRQSDGMLLIRSDNSAYEPSRAKPDDLSTIGRVLWIGGRP
ncbi:MAG TPA: helix-turn-helix transcriptional regulator [Candidatus Binataceae bacterium]|nr:helix-turn-helix transcriptional regulator [Candidatus Binataceae bacterium]